LERSSCDNIQDMLFEYLDNELSEKDRKTVDDHIKECEKCRKELEVRRELLKLISDSAYYPKSELAAAFSGDNTVLRKPVKFNILRYGTVAAAAVLMAAIALSQGTIERFIGSDNAAMESAVMDSANGSAAQTEYSAAETYPETTAAAYSTSTTVAGTEETNAVSADTEPQSKLMFSVSTAEKVQETGAAEQPQANSALTGGGNTEATADSYSGSDTVLYSARADDIALMAAPDEIMSAWLNACAPMYAEDTAVLYVLKPGDIPEIDESKALEVIRDNYTVTYVFENEDAWKKISESIIGSREYYVYRNEKNKSAVYAVVVYDLPLEQSGVN